MEIIKWGLEHIDGLKKSRTERRESLIKVVSTILIPLMSSIVAIVAILSTQWSQKVQQAEQAKLTYYGVELLPKTQSYITFIKSIDQASEFTKNNNLNELNNSLNAADLALSSFEPYFVDTSEIKQKSKEIWSKFHSFSENCHKLVGQKQSADQLEKYQEDYNQTRENFKTQLSNLLFKP